jgi:cytosine/adenosine deaminase-related metal-dependent hydrolase
MQESLKRFGRRPIEEFFDRGILGPRTVVAHGVWLDDREIALLAQTGTSVAHCPASNIASLLREQGVAANVGDQEGPDAGRVIRSVRGPSVSFFDDPA